MDMRPQDELPTDGSSEAPVAASEISSRFWLHSSLGFYAAMALVALVWRWGFAKKPVWFVGSTAEATAGSTAWDVALGLGVGLAIVGCSHVWIARTASGQRLAEAMGKAIAGLKVWHALVLAAASGLAEELFFRGALQPTVGWALASLCFGLIHFVPRREFLPWTGFAIVAGGILGGLVIWTGNLLAAVVAHIVVNAINLPMLVRRYGNPSSPHSEDS